MWEVRGEAWKVDRCIVLALPAMPPSTHSQNTSSSRRAPSSSFIHPGKVPLVTGNIQSQVVAMFVLSILELEWALNLNLIYFDVFPRSLEPLQSSCCRASWVLFHRAVKSPTHLAYTCSPGVVLHFQPYMRFEALR